MPIEKISADSPESKSADLRADNLAKIKALFPDLVTEGQDGVAVDVNVLKQLVGDRSVAETEEKFGLNWHGKRKARQLALTPSTGTLRPCTKESEDWDTTRNLMIEGDNLEVLKLLQKSYTGKVKMIFIDPPYNTGKDFVYPDDFQDNIKNYLELTGQVKSGKKMVANTEASGRFHTDWLNMMLPRLKIARSLLRDDGVILISIDDNEVDNLRTLCDEVFGEENFCSQITVINNLKGRNDRKHVATCHEYLVAYAKTNAAELGGLPLTDEQRAEFKYTDAKGEKYALRDLRKRGRPDKREDRPKMWFPIYFNKKSKKCSLERSSNEDVAITPLRGDGSDGRWRWGLERVRDNLDILEPRYSAKNDRWDIDHRVYLNTTSPISIDGEDDLDDDEESIERSSKSKSVWMGGEISTDVGRRCLKELIPEVEYDYPKAVDFIKKCIHIGAGRSGIVLDFFAGSGTTGQAIQEMVNEGLNDCRFILVQVPEPMDSKKFETIAEVTKERLRRSREKIRTSSLLSKGDLGFRVYKLDSSNIREWDPKRDDMAATLDEHAEHLKTGRSESDILTELLLKLGLDLCVPVEKRTVADTTVYSIGAGALFACLPEKITRAQVKPLAQGILAWREELKVAVKSEFVFRDSAFADDVAKTNLAAYIEQNLPESQRGRLRSL